MKTFFLCLILAVISVQAFTQQSGIVAQSGTIGYEYTPPPRLALPTNIFASLVYKVGEEHYFVRKPLLRKKEKYVFDFSPPDSVRAFVLSITDSKHQNIDNNLDSGYTVLRKQYLNDKAAANEEAAWLLSYFAPATLDLNRRILPAKMVALYDEAFQLSPAIKEDYKTYRYYLFLLNQLKGDSIQAQLLEYAAKMEAGNDEISLGTALYIQRFLRQDSGVSRIENKSIALFPSGEVAREKYINAFYEKREQTATAILQDANEYVRLFGDTSSRMKYTFYSTLIELLLIKNQFDQIDKYEPYLKNSINLSTLYHGKARQLIKGKTPTDSALITARWLIQKTLTILDSKKSLLHSAPDDLTFVKSWNRAAETYARIFFLQNQYDSAFKYQSLVVSQPIDPATADASVQTLITYASKAKGDQYARKLAIELLKSANASSGIREELKILNTKLGYAETAELEASGKSSDLSESKMAHAIRKRFGSSGFRNFSLTDLSGKTISLSSFSNKVVVLDFWATWCGPCLASFPRMQEVIGKYKQDSSVVFLFIDTWEDKSLEKMKIDAAKLMKERKYDFQILLDDKNAANNAYKVDVIPETFIINKAGKIVYMGIDNENIIAEIENAKLLAH
ncbi:TlpA family protein disulfide reductase [Pseudoflavitalea sp. G-6-1-2]|uniref:TlpA family protein disulfide reductase n=1 Tax=Pseudoflavitalea sp. G-6-1-2 TaxID=2728841 RepID=UPI00146C4FB3|nr:TlpA disulfide reductase family protein [Pseudoflavitalea sp. G-6-1-2]NML19304.1 TlpA family protein disulfide reductase [Pseudoflavitalea sp. G-6-1-2]